MRWIVMGLTAALVLLLLNQTAHAETWKCNYSGRWLTRSTGNWGNFSWRLTWRSAPGKWIVTGNYNDRYGFSYLDGVCQKKLCLLTQTYRHGQLAGKRYYWQGTYRDKWEGPAKTINTFTGTWGYSPGNRADGGPWNAIATCFKL